MKVSFSFVYEKVYLVTGPFYQLLYLLNTYLHLKFNYFKLFLQNMNKMSVSAAVGSHLAFRPHPNRRVDSLSFHAGF